MFNCQIPTKNAMFQKKVIYNSIKNCINLGNGDWQMVKSSVRIAVKTLYEFFEDNNFLRSEEPRF